MQNLSHQNPRKVVKVWAEKEFKNLNRIHRVGLPSPRPIRLNGNVIMMEFIGKSGWAAPQLREVKIKSQKRLRQLYVECALFLRAMWWKARIVHADFSEFNILYVAEGKPPRLRVIDVGQAVEVTTPNAKALLRRDCANITSYFQKRGLTSYILSLDALLSFVVESMNGGEDADESEVDKSAPFGGSKRAAALMDYALSLGKFVENRAARALVTRLKHV